MRTDRLVNSDWRRRSKWWLPLMVFLIGAQTLRLVFDVRSLNDALVMVTVVASILLAGVATGLVAARLRARRIAIRSAGRPDARCWQVSDGVLTRFLIIDETSVALVTRSSHVDRSWRRGQVRQATVALVANGFPSRPGLQIDFYGHAHERVELVFPRWLGLWSSRDEAFEAQQVLQPIHADRRRDHRNQDDIQTQ